MHAESFVNLTFVIIVRSTQEFFKRSSIGNEILYNQYLFDYQYKNHELKCMHWRFLLLDLLI